MARKPAKPESSPRPPDPSRGQPAANVASQEAPATGAGPQGQSTDDAPEPKSHAQAPRATAQPPADVQPESVTVAFPLPGEIPAAVLDVSLVIVRAKPARGRRRAGRDFTREETAIPYRDLAAAQIEALTTDSELTVSLRVPRNAPD